MAFWGVMTRSCFISRASSIVLWSKVKKNVGAGRDRDASLALFGVQTKQAVLLCS